MNEELSVSDIYRAKKKKDRRPSCNSGKNPSLVLLIDRKTLDWTSRLKRILTDFPEK